MFPAIAQTLIAATKVIILLVVLAVLGLLVAGCGGEDEWKCDLDMRSGAYDLEAEEEPSGTCGPMPDTSGMAGALPPGCAIMSAHLSENQCTVSTQLSCYDAASDTTISITVESEQLDEDADRLEGAALLIIRSPEGLVCASRYRATWTRP